MTGPRAAHAHPALVLRAELPEPHHFNQSVLLELRERARRRAAGAGAARLIAHHDALRLRFTREAERVAAAQRRAWSGRSSLQRVDLSARPGRGAPAALDAAAARVQARPGAGRGALLRAASVRPGPARPARLLLVIHHLVVDGVSWRILLEDLSTACMQLRRGEAVALPPKTHLLPGVGRAAPEYARLGALGAPSWPYWLEERARPGAPAAGGPGRGANTVASDARVTVALERGGDAGAAAGGPRGLRARIHEVLLAALAQALRAGRARGCWWTEGHGREELFDGRGPVAHRGLVHRLYPVRLEVPAGASPATGCGRSRTCCGGARTGASATGCCATWRRGRGAAAARCLARGGGLQLPGPVRLAGGRGRLFALAREPGGPATSEQGARPPAGGERAVHGRAGCS